LYVVARAPVRETTQNGPFGLLGPVAGTLVRAGVAGRVPRYRRMVVARTAGGSLARVITAAAICPHPPLLLRELTGGHDVAADLRGACAGAVRRLVADADRVIAVGGAESTERRDPAHEPPVRRLGTTGARGVAPELPLSLGIGHRLLVEAGWTGPVELLGVDRHADAAEVARVAADLGRDLGGASERVAVLVLGDGSARRGEKAPGFLDERAADVDEVIATALERGDAAALAGLDPAAAEDLLVQGRAAFAVLGALVRVAQLTVVRPELCYRDDPFGVSYFVALWPFADGSER
jgi:hypothetical protein